MAKFCPKCGIKLNDDAIFCGSCGYKIPENDANNTIVQTENNIHQETSAEKILNTNNLNNDDIYITDKTFADMFFKKDGRLNRWRYFKRMLLVSIIRFIIIIGLVIIMADDFGNTSTGEDVFITIVSLCFLIPEYFLTVRRLKDLNTKDLSWAYWLAGVDALYFILIVYLGIFLYLLLKKAHKEKISMELIH